MPDNIITGYYKNTKNLQVISNYIYNNTRNKDIAHHMWINKIDSKEIYSILDKIRMSNDILNAIQTKFPNYRIKNVKEADEIYYGVSPKEAGYSDRSLVDCHYDAPFSKLNLGGVKFYRVIIACNENKTVNTQFPNDNISVIMNTGEFHGLDYNEDLHCVYGSIPKNKYRVLLKLHYLIIPEHLPDNSFYEKYVEYINIKWTELSREFMRMSAKPENFTERIFGNIVNICRIVYNNIYIFIITLIIFLVFLFFFLHKKYTFIKKLIFRKQK